jgi:hypothetical protein
MVRTIREIDYDSSLEKQSIFQTKIMGKKDIDLQKAVQTIMSVWTAVYGMLFLYGVYIMNRFKG